MCVLLAERVCVHDFLHFPALPEMMSVLCSKDSWYPNFTWLPWYLIGTNYPECVGHFLVKCSGRSRRLTLHQSREVFSVKSSDYWERRSHLGKIKRFSLFAGFSLFSPFYSRKWFPDSSKVSVSLNEMSDVWFFFFSITFLDVSVFALIWWKHWISFLSPRRNHPLINVLSLFLQFQLFFIPDSHPVFPLSLNLIIYLSLHSTDPLSSFSSLLHRIWFKLPKATVKMQWLQHH